MTADLFESEMAALQRARNALGQHAADAAFYREALEDLLQHYQRLMRETSRLIRHGDRTEAELTAVNARLQQLSAELDYKARHDTLTGVLNRGAVFNEAQQQLACSPLSLVLLDIDFFKRINDAFGHPAGDAVIRELIERLSRVLGERGQLGRVGGEEFTILLPGMILEEALELAEHLRCAIAEHPFACLPGHPVSASFGVSWSPAGADFELAYARADEALYRAKGQGRNRVAC